MNKIGLLTFPRYFNYGTQLQLFALQTVIERLGYPCEVLDYHRLYETPNQQAEIRNRRWKRLQTLMGDPLRIIRHRPLKQYGRLFSELTRTREALFQDFLETRIHLGAERYSSYHELVRNPPTCRAYVVGSDQVWNPVSHFEDSSYFLGFTNKERRISYAPSIGMAVIPVIAKEWMRQGIEGIPYLSVREKRGAELIRELTGREARVVLDPTLLLSRLDWEEVCVATVRRRPYVLCYFLESDSYMRDRAREIALQHDCDLVVIPVHRIDVENTTHKMQKEYDVGPQEFLGLFKNATCVCTDSFHGTVFSTLFRRPFFTFRRYANVAEAALHSRIRNILEITELTQREISCNAPLPKHPLDIDYTELDTHLDVWRNDSSEFLRNALQEATR